MRQVAMEHVQPGMVVARSVPAPGAAGGVPLLAAGVTITESIRERLVKSDVQAVFIDDLLSEGIESTPPITDKVRRQAVGVMRETYSSVRDGSTALRHEQLQSVENIMNALMAEIASRRNLLVCLSDLNVFGGDRMQLAVNTCVVGTAIGLYYFTEHGWVDFRGNRRDDRIPDRLQKLGMGLLLQDIGTLAIPESVRDKGGLLTSEERQLMQTHPLLGVEMLETSDISPLTKVTVAQHHERYDGSGYPRGLAGDDIHDHGSIAAVAETFVSLTNRDQGTKKEPMAPHMAWNLIGKASGKLFRPEVVAAFQQVIVPYGAGTSVRLTDGKYAIVDTPIPGEPLRPKVRVVADGDGLLFDPPREMDLSRERGLRIKEAVGGLPSDREFAAVDVPDVEPDVAQG